MNTTQNYTEEIIFKNYIKQILNNHFNLRDTQKEEDSPIPSQTPELLTQFNGYGSQNYYLSKMVLSIDYKEEKLFKRLFTFSVDEKYYYEDFTFIVTKCDDEGVSFNIFDIRGLLIGELIFDLKPQNIGFLVDVSLNVGDRFLRNPMFGECDRISKVMEISVLLAKLNFRFNGIKELEIKTHCSSFVIPQLKQYLYDPNYELWVKDQLVTDKAKKEIFENSYSLGTYTDGSHDIRCHSSFKIEENNGDIKLIGRVEEGNVMDEAIFSLQLRGNGLKNALCHLEQEDDEWNSKLFVDLAFTDCLKDIFLKETSDIFYFMSHNDGQIVNLATFLA